MKKILNQFVFYSSLKRTIKPFSLLMFCFMFSNSFYMNANEPLLQEKREITGKITEASTGKPLPGVSILIKGTTEGTITSADGNYSIMATQNDVLIFSIIEVTFLQLQVNFGD